MNDFSLILKEHYYGVYMLVRKRLSQALAYIRDDLEVCNIVPEIDIILKD